MKKGAMNTDRRKQIGSHALLTNEKDHWEITVTENIVKGATGGNVRRRTGGKTKFSAC